MAVSNDYIQYVLDQLLGWGDVYTKRMFGGAALYQEGLAFGMIANNVVYLKVDHTNREKYLKEDSIQLKPFENNSIVLSYYSVPAGVLENSSKFINWASESYAIQKKRNYTF